MANGLWKGEDFKSELDTSPGVSSPRVPLTTLRFRRRRSRFRKSSFYEAPLTNKIPLKVFFFLFSLALLRIENFSEHALEALVFLLPAADPVGASGVNVITCHSAVWSADTEMLLFSTSLPRRDQ